jgi:HEAT repeat protein
MAKQDNAIREVFDVDSTVRLDAIQNLTKFQTPPVIDALRKLLQDGDANVRSLPSTLHGWP